MHQRSQRREPGEHQQAVVAVSGETLLKQIRVRVPGGARDLAVDVRIEPRTVMLTGSVVSFYAKQVLYHLCNQWAPGFRVIDATVVAAGSDAKTA
jgi:hypothetical protein